MAVKTWKDRVIEYLISVLQETCQCYSPKEYCNTCHELGTVHEMIVKGNAADLANEEAEAKRAAIGVKA